MVKIFNEKEESGSPGERDPIAKASTPLKPLCDGNLNDMRLDLGPVGTVDLCVHYEPLDEDTLEQLPHKVR